MPLPFVYPKSEGPGRMTEICSFRKSEIPQTQFEKTYDETMAKMAEWPISRKSILANQFEDQEIAVLIADWTSAADKDAFEPGQEYKDLKPNFMTLINSQKPSFKCHHIILPGFAETPTCDWYTISHMRIPIGKQEEAVEAFEAYIKSHTPDDLVFLAVASSREDPEVVVVHSGHQQEVNATIGAQSLEHDRIKERLGKVVEEGTKYAAQITISKSLR